MSVSDRGAERPAVRAPVVVGGIVIAVAFFLSLKFQLFSRTYGPLTGLLGGTFAGLLAARTRDRADGVAWLGVRAGVLATVLSFFVFVGFDFLVVFKHGVEPVSGFARGGFRLDTGTRLIIFVLTEGVIVFLYSVTLLFGSAVGAWGACTTALLVEERRQR